MFDAVQGLVGPVEVGEGRHLGRVVGLVRVPIRRVDFVETWFWSHLKAKISSYKVLEYQWICQGRNDGRLPRL